MYFVSVFVKILHSVRGMANNIPVFMYSVPQMAVVQYPEKSKIQALENILRSHACNFDISENRFCIFMVGGGWELLTKCGMLIFVQSVGIYTFLM